MLYIIAEMTNLSKKQSLSIIILKCRIKCDASLFFHFVKNI